MNTWTVGALAVVSAAWPCVAGAQLIDETFQNNTVSGWTLTGLGMGGGPSAQGNPCLTAPGGAQSCDATANVLNYNDPAGAGWLRLTTSDNDQAANVISSGAIPFGQGIDITFDYAMYAGQPAPQPPPPPLDHLNEADGISVFITDADVPGNGAIDIGDVFFGGSLGYCGMTGAVLGVGLDNFGNFSGGPFTNCPMDGTGFTPEAVVVRGGSTATPPYEFFTGVSTMGQLRTDASWTAPNGARVGKRVRFRVVEDPGCGMAIPWRILLQNLTDAVTWVDACLDALSDSTFVAPASVRVGFSAATGDGTQYQEIRLLTVNACPCPDDTPTSSPTATSTGTATPTSTSSETPTATQTATPPETATNTATRTSSPTTTDTPIPTSTPTPQPQGAACTAGTQCVSSFCADGVCCDRACSGRGERCNAANQPGVCVDETQPAHALSPLALVLATALVSAIAGRALRRRRG